MTKTAESNKEGVKNMKRSKRIETLDKRPVNLDGYINE